MTRYSWPSPIAVSAISRMLAPPSEAIGVRVAVPAERLTQRLRALVQRPAPGRLEPPQVDRLLAAQALLDRALGDLADARQLAQRAVAGAHSATRSGPSSASVVAAPRKARTR